MWGRLFLGLVLAVALVAGYPYAALLLNRIIGTNTVVFTERDGTQSTPPLQTSKVIIGR
jgi:hypothetical protein